MKKILNNRSKTKVIDGILIILFLIILDQATKYLAVLHLKDAPPLELIPGVFELYYLENRGAAFSILWGQKNFFVILTAFLFLIMFYLYLRMPEDKRFKWAKLVFILLMGGAVGNLIDRVRQEYVVDFFYFKLINFAVFNVADIYITVGAFLFVLTFCFYYKEEEMEKILPFLKKKEK
ncbi:MAG: signal peptidase II [Roseburia sp.]|nr:signal peptidase II [Roseburia sp.]